MLPSTSLFDVACPSNPALHRNHLIKALQLTINTDFSSDGVIDLTHHIDRGEYVAAGAFGQVHKGKWKGVNDLLVNDSHVLPVVAVKVIALPVILRNEKEKANRLKKLKREVDLWNSLDHDNILPLIGTACINGDPNLFALISPWMEHGTVKDYLKENPFESPFGFVRDIIEGLYYLHHFNPEIIHGDIKAVNVLVNHRKEGYLCDFGLSRMTKNGSLWFTSATHAGGTLRWMAPELLLGKEECATKASDIYAYGMTIYEILSGDVPFASLRDGVVIMSIASKQRPSRDILAPHSEDIWNIITQCWAHEPKDRPSAAAALSSVREATVQGTLLSVSRGVAQVEASENLSADVELDMTVITPAEQRDTLINYSNEPSDVQFSTRHLTSSPNDGTVRLLDDHNDYPPDFMFDRRVMTRLKDAAKPAFARCQLYILAPQDTTCDIAVTFSPLWQIGASYPPASSIAWNRMRATPGGLIEDLTSKLPCSSLYYEATPDALALTTKSLVSRAYSFAMPTDVFVHHIVSILEGFGVNVTKRTTLLQPNLSNFYAHSNIAFRLMHPKRLSAGMDISINQQNCHFLRLFIVWKGVDNQELEVFETYGAGYREACSMDWRAHLGVLDSGWEKDKGLLRVIETSILEVV